MKKLLCATLCLLMALSVLPALADSVSEVMQVVNCNEYVSLRKTPDTSADRLAKVHLGEFVTNCAEASNGFVYCTWDGKTGYILAKYLKTTPWSTSNEKIIPNQMVCNCSEYVSLRQYPDTNSTRLQKVPLNAIVTGCIRYNDQFVWCTYKKDSGYILAKYLKKANYNVKTTPTPTPKPKVTPTPKVYPALPYYMQVVNCNEYVSLRKTASTSAQVLKKVPLGSVVEGCVQVSDSFVSCTFDGASGYIAKQYLAAYEPPQDSSFSDLNNPAYEIFKTRGSEVIEYTTANGYTVAVRRGYTQEHEEIMAVCYDVNKKPVWSKKDESAYTTELTLTHAFVTQLNGQDLLVMYVSGKGFTAYTIGAWGDQIWKQDDAAVEKLGGSLSVAVQSDGTFYVTGYYSATLMAFAPSGKLLWECEYVDENVYWPYHIDLAPEGIYVYYASGENGDLVWRGLFSYFGQYVSTDKVPEPDWEEAFE